MPWCFEGQGCNYFDNARNYDIKIERLQEQSFLNMKKNYVSSWIEINIRLVLKVYEVQVLNLLAIYNWH
jgi:hypothetical protein